MGNFWETLAEYLRKYRPTWRVGQCYFNALDETYPDLADTIRGTTTDPFYDDTRVPAFVELLQKRGIE